MAVTAFSVYCSEACAVGNSRRPFHPAITRGLQYMEKRLEEPLQLFSISQVAGLSSNHFSRLFRRLIHCAPIEYLWRIRVQKAASLLRDTGLSTAEIAARTGFQNPFHLSRRFKSAYGMSLTEYRSHIWDVREALSESPVG